jgi:hypothetical protein
MSKLAALLLPLLLNGIARADDSDPAGRVARVAFVQGRVSVAPAGLDDWAAVDLNRPLTTGDRLWSDADSRAELGIGSAVVRLGSATGFSFLNLEQNTAQMQVSAGTVSIHVRSPSDALEVDTPNVAIGLLGPGDYRVEVNEAGDTTVVKVSGGTAEVTGGGQDFAVHPQQLATFTGTTQVSEGVASLGAPDALDAWAYARDRQTQQAQAWSYVSPDVVGAEDLDQNGTWESTPDDGTVWAPNTVAVGWAPYRFGHWVWISPWGWTWVDDAPWGFAPFHYGRWATFGGRWCWVPGPRRGNPVYAPALVAWVGGAPFGASAAFAGAGGVAWFPLGPREVYVPAYPASQTYVRSINISNTPVSGSEVMSVYNHPAQNIRYVNRNAPGGLTAISQATLVSAQSVSRHVVHLSANEIAAAPVSAIAPAITPARQSLLGAGASGPGIHRPPPVLLNRFVLAKTPPPPAPVPFELQQDAIRANGGRPLARPEVAAMQILAPAAHVRMAVPAVAPRTGMSRAARSSPPSVPSRPVLPAGSRASSDRAAAQAPAAASQPPAPPDAESVKRADRPPAPAGEAATEERPPARPVPGAAEVRRVTPPEISNRRTDQRAAPPAAAAPAPPPVYAAPPPIPPPPPLPPAKVEERPAARPAAHSAQPARPMERGN